MHTHQYYSIEEMKAKFGGFNDFPPQWRSISAKEFGRTMNHYSTVGTDFRQMIDYNTNNPAMSATLFFYHDDTGIAVNDKGEMFAFGCNHQYEATPWDYDTMGPHFNCNSAYKCTKCGHISVIDSSD